MGNLILLADDSPDDVLFFKRVLEAICVSNPLHVVGDGQEAIAYLMGEGEYADRVRHPKPCILFLDLLMPGADGWVVMEWLAKHPQSNLLVFVLSNVGDYTRLHEAYSLGAHSFILKPVQAAELRALIQYWPGPWKIRTPDFMRASGVRE